MRDLYIWIITILVLISIFFLSLMITPVDNIENESMENFCLIKDLEYQMQSFKDRAEEILSKDAQDYRAGPRLTEERT